MWHVLDVLLIVVVVLFSGLYALYSMSSVAIKRALLSLLVRGFGVRVFSVFSPRLSGCSNCAAGEHNLELLRKLKAPK